MKLISVALKDFKGVKTLTFDKFGQSDLTVIQGDNGSGKSTLLDALAYVMDGSPELFGVKHFSELVRLKTPGCKVAIKVMQDNGSVVTLRKESFENNTWCYFEENRISNKDYIKLMKELNIKRDYCFIPILTSFINNLPKASDKYGDYFDNLSGANELHLEDRENKKKIRRASKNLEKMQEQRISMEYEKSKMADLFMGQLYYLETLIKKKTREIGTEKERQMILKMTPGGSQVDQNKVQKLEKELEEFHAKRFYYMRQCELNQIELPGKTLSVLTNKELKTPQTLSEKKSVTQNQIKKGKKIQIDFTEFKRRNPTLNDENSIKSFCDWTELELNASRSKFKTVNKPSSSSILKESSLNHQIAEEEKKIDEYQDLSYDLGHQRRDCFNEFFRLVAGRIDQEYKALWGDEKRGASLEIEDEEKPWEEVKFVLRNRKEETHFKDMYGGEQKMAQIALFFALVSATSSPIAVIDDVDKYIGEQAFQKLIKYLVEKSKTCQVIVTGSNPDFFEFIGLNNIPVLKL
ncbi:hypothetical protein CAEBREN_26183 [Caenorhabditis brenneri]|uniref:RecF/RecN/SMC N-terminal domain-containing protein n=1 Tax=Caenorhabditis brenneri TaxID=135651 RepID=G0MQQ2_CAEBE|nr:hypothetical protein CAEBREN_26183 [Caenorhabditis brenneri]